MRAAEIVFYFISGLILVPAFLSVSTRKIFRAAVYLLFSLIGVAGLYFYLDNNFIAAVQIVVYVGGIVVLIIFSIFLTQQSGSDMKEPKDKRALFAQLAAFCGFFLTFIQLITHNFKPMVEPGQVPDMAAIGNAMLSTGKGGYALPFEVVSILLLAAMIGCIVIAMKTKTETETK